MVKEVRSSTSWINEVSELFKKFFREDGAMVKTTNGKFRVIKRVERKAGFLSVKFDEYYLVEADYSFINNGGGPGHGRPGPLEVMVNGAGYIDATRNLAKEYERRYSQNVKIIQNY